MKLKARLHIQRESFTLKVDLDMPLQGITGVFGPSGSGKTSLLRSIAGLDRHPGAYLEMAGTLWQDDRYFLPPHRRDLAYVFQEASLFPHLTVRGNIEYGMKRIAREKRRIELDQVIDLLGLESLLDRKSERLSGGERQRVAIARALAVSPGLLLMDEPLASLDKKRRDEILPYLESLNKETDIPVIYVSHAIDEIARLSDQLILLDQGVICGSGPIHDMLTRTDLLLAHRPDAEALIEAVAGAYDHQYHLNRLDFAGGHFLVSGPSLAEGKKVRLRLSAQDVSLTLEHQSSTSILNIFPAVVDVISVEENAQATVRLLIDGTPILARITAKSAAVLNLKPGAQVYAQVKSVAVLA